MRRWMIAAVMALGLGGCAADLPDPGQIRLAGPEALPLRARVMLEVAQSDLDRKFSYELNSISRQETDIKEGVALQQAANTLFSHAFTTVATNQPAPLPDLIARITGTAKFDRVAGTFRIMCGIDVVRTDGIPLGHYYDAYKSKPVMSIESNLPRVYAQCLKGPLEQLLRSPDFTRLATAGFPAADPAASVGYLRSQGYVVR